MRRVRTGVRHGARTAFATALLACALCATASAAPAPKPKPTAVPPPRFQTSAKFRAVFLNRQPYSNPAAAGVKALPPNASGQNFGVALHGQYNFSPKWSAGATYYGAYPFSANGPCSDVANYAAGGTCTPALQARVDPTLPVFPLSTLGEAYVDYHAPAFHVRIGNQLLQTPWAQPLDGRLKPVLFQGIASDIDLGKGLTLSIDRITRFESRTSSAFLPTTFVTKPSQFVSGMLYTSLQYKAKSPFSGLVGLYNFYDIANMLYAEGTVSPAPKSPLAPALSLQYVSEQSAGRAYAGLIDNQTFGARGQVRLGPNFVFSGAMDTAPWRSKTVAAPSAAAAIAPFFAPIGGTPVVKAGPAGTYTVYYGGIASPYTGAYSGDALFTSSIPTNSMAQRQSAGTSDKFTLVFKTNSARLLMLLAHADFDYSNGAGSEKTEANYVDATYFFGPKTKSGFRGLSIRDRYSERTQTNVKLFGGFPSFKYNMLYFEYNL